MQMYNYIVVVSTILGWYIVSGAKQQSFYHVHNGYEFTNFYEERNLPSLVRCASFCNISSSCVAATFDVSLKQCLLSDQMIYVVNSTANPNKRTIILNDTGDSECSILPTVPNGAISVSITSTGYKAILSCNMYYKPISALNTFTCSHTNGWTDNMKCIPVNSVTMGTSFVLGFMQGLVLGIPKLLIASDQTATVRIEMPWSGTDVTRTVSNISGLVYTFDTSIAVTTSRQIQQKAVFVTSDVPIQVYSNLYHSYSVDGSVVLPTHCLGKEFFVAGYPDPALMDLFLMTSTNDGTTVSITYTNATIETMALNANDTYLIKDFNLSGTKVNASNPINLQSANECAEVPNNGFLYCDFLEETMPPVTSLGTTHIISYMYPRPDFTIGIIVTQISTNVKVHDRNGTLIEDLTDLGQSATIFRTFYGHQTISVISNKPIMIHQYGHGSYGVWGDPSMMFKPDVEFYGQHYNFVIPTEPLDWVLTVIISDTLSASILKLNGQPLITSHTVSVTLPDNTKYTVIYNNITAGTYLLTHDYGATPIYGAWVYGRSIYVEVAYVLGYQSVC